MRRHQYVVSFDVAVHCRCSQGVYASWGPAHHANLLRCRSQRGCAFCPCFSKDSLSVQCQNLMQIRALPLTVPKALSRTVIAAVALAIRGILWRATTRASVGFPNRTLGLSLWPSAEDRLGKCTLRSRPLGEVVIAEANRRSAVYSGLRWFLVQHRTQV